MTAKAQILFISGSTRNGSVNMQLTVLAQRIAESQGLKTTLCNLSNYPLPIYDGDLEQEQGIPENAFKIKRLMDAHNGVFISSPEYNAGIPPLLKNVIDWLSRISEGGQPSGTVFRTRAFMLAAASPSETGGIRGLIQLRQTLAVGLGAYVLGGQVLVPSANSAFGDDGSLNDEKRQSIMAGMIERLADHASKLYPTE